MVDPIRLELIKNALVMVSDNMMVSVLRTARSTLVKSNMDFSASILDAEGDMVAQGLATFQGVNRRFDKHIDTERPTPNPQIIPFTAPLIKDFFLNSSRLYIFVI